MFVPNKPSKHCFFALLESQCYYYVSFLSIICVCVVYVSWWWCVCVCVRMIITDWQQHDCVCVCLPVSIYFIRKVVENLFFFLVCLAAFFLSEENLKDIIIVYNKRFDLICDVNVHVIGLWFLLFLLFLLLVVSF